jgi:hypothetical protein
MSKLSPRPVGQDPVEHPENLADRIAARVVQARLALEQDAADASSTGTSMDSKAVGELREAQSLKRVFRELGVSYRRYRRQTGGPVTPGLRDAAYQFRADPSLTSLVAVAAYLDRLDLLS